MVCANILLTIAALLCFLAVVWPGFGAATIWVVGISAAVIVIVAWIGTECGWCKTAKKK
ncbi:hypothetical protein GF342_00630 [Candidatus Woesearchaeota archaeon]|nr:hypothetical protein [Candidatus Woesearchaeota archaeon]